MCTTLLVKAQDGAVVSGRTMEFGFDVESNVMVIPAGTPMTGSLPNDTQGMSYTTEFGMIGANALGYPVIVDGINERGLFFSALYFPGFAGYKDVGPKSVDAARAIAPHEFGNWVLGTCATVEDVKANVGQILLANTVVPALGGAAPLHFIIRDPSGQSVVIEPIDGTLKVYDNPVGVMTNSPPFDWHLLNLRNYVGLAAQNVASVLLGDGLDRPLELEQFGQGNGLFGLPGDSTPPSRFVRAVAYSQTALQTLTGPDAVLQVFHIMNNFDITVGSVREKVKGPEAEEVEFHCDYTVWTSVADLTNCRWYFRTYNDQTIRMVDARKALNATNTVRLIAMNSVQPVVDASTDFVSAVPL